VPYTQGRAELGKYEKHRLALVLRENFPGTFDGGRAIEDLGEGHDNAHFKLRQSGHGRFIILQYCQFGDVLWPD
jgi:hypothetical protein